MELLILDTRLDVFRFCGVQDLGACLAVSRSWHTDADSNPVWVDTYESTQKVDPTSEPSGEGALRALIQRPFGEDAVAWRVEVLREDGTEHYAAGRIVAYNAETDAYLVSYEGDDSSLPTEAWEQERRKRTAAMRHNPSLAGKSRFSFVAPPARAWPHRDFSSSSVSSGCGPLLRFESWKRELEHNVRNAPSRFLRRLESHRDEVLFVVFSPCGTRLASCSRDLRTIVFRIVPPGPGADGGGGSSAASSQHQNGGSSGSRSLGVATGGAAQQTTSSSPLAPPPEQDPVFEQEAVFEHHTAPCRAIWWPIPPYTMVAVSTEDAGWQGTSKVEIWEVLTPEAPPLEACPPPEPGGECCRDSSTAVLSRSPTQSPRTAPGNPEVDEGENQYDEEEGSVQGVSTSLLPGVGQNSRCIFRGQNRPFDIYAAIFAWPPAAAAAAAALDSKEEETDALLQDAATTALRDSASSLPQAPSANSQFQDPASLCFLAGYAVFRENEHYVQWLNVWPGPKHPRFRTGQQGIQGQNALVPLAQLRLEGDMNYLHCLEVGPGAMSSRILAMTGSTPHLCDEIGLIDLGRLSHRDEGGDQESQIPAFDAPVEVKAMGDRVVLSAKWNRRGDLLLLNTRPYAQSERGARLGSSPSAPRQPQGASFEELLLRPAPDLSTSMELLLLDSVTLQAVGVFDGHFAFTTKESPFLIFTDEWGDSDFLASGGEDHRVYIWHRRHRRLLRRLCGHTEPVNAVSWNGAGLLASASDDHSIIIWAAGEAADEREKGSGGSITSTGGVDHASVGDRGSPVTSSSMMEL